MESLRNRALAEMVEERLMEDTRLAGQCFTVSAANGHIQISGCMDTEEHKQIALELARGMSGVRYVEDHLRVRRQVSPLTPRCE